MEFGKKIHKGDKKIMKKTYIKAYAKLIARCGVNIKRGDEVIINASLDAPDFICMVAEECYRAGAARVMIEWSCLTKTRMDMKYMTAKRLGVVEAWEEAKLKYRLEKDPAMIYILSDDPDGLRGIDQKKYTSAMIEKLKVIKPYRDQMENKYKWCIAAVPGEAWAKKVFPGVRASVAIEKLWEAILLTSRVIDKEGNLLDPVAEWDKHNQSFIDRASVLNAQKIKTLHYTSKNGTDLKVGLMDKSVFVGGGEETLGGEYFNPNIPTEELFTTPKAGEAEGIVYSAMPLSWRGEIIDNFSMKFEGGRVVEVKAEKNEELLRQMVNMDEGAAKLGECALVPFESPIRQSGIMFYETLFDENASCHFAVGRGFNNCVEGFESLTNEEMKEMGVNDSSIHVDFMIGSDDLNIVGIREDGSEFKIFENGTWAF